MVDRERKSPKAGSAAQIPTRKGFDQRLHPDTTCGMPGWRIRTLSSSGSAGSQSGSMASTVYPPASAGQKQQGPRPCWTSSGGSSRTPSASDRAWNSTTMVSGKSAVEDAANRAHAISPPDTSSPSDQGVTKGRGSNATWTRGEPSMSYVGTRLGTGSAICSRVQTSLNWDGNPSYRASTAKSVSWFSGAGASICSPVRESLPVSVSTTHQLGPVAVNLAERIR